QGDDEGTFDLSQMRPNQPVIRSVTEHSRLCRILYLGYLYASTMLPPRLTAAEVAAEFTRLKNAAARVNAQLVPLLPEAAKFEPQWASIGSRGYYLPTLPQDPRFYLSDHDHWTPHGNRVIADAVSDILVEVLDRGASSTAGGP